MTDTTMTTIQQLDKIEQNGMRVLTTAQLAECYETDTRTIKQNFNNNKFHYEEGKHYIRLEGDVLKGFKDKVENFDLVQKNAKILYLWTERGALLHAKSLNTDKAWEVYEGLMEFYFTIKENELAVTSKSDFVELQAKINMLTKTLSIMQCQLQDHASLKSMQPDIQAHNVWKKQNVEQRTIELASYLNIPIVDAYKSVYRAMFNKYGFNACVAMREYMHKYNLTSNVGVSTITAIADVPLYREEYITCLNELLEQAKNVNEIIESENTITDIKDRVAVEISLIVHRPFTITDDYETILDSIRYLAKDDTSIIIIKKRIYSKMYTKYIWDKTLREHNLGGNKKLAIKSIPDCKARFVEVCNELVEEYKKQGGLTAP